MAKRYRKPAGATPTASEFVLAKNKLVAEIGDYMSRCAALSSPPLEYIEKLRDFQSEVEYCREDELPAYVDHFKKITSA